jgi:small subunit ribosomal protein S4
VNGEVVNAPSYLVNPGDLVAVRERSKKQLRIQDALNVAEQYGMPAWVEVDAKKMEGLFKSAPDRDELPSDINESLVVELYSK